MLSILFSFFEFALRLHSHQQPPARSQLVEKIDIFSLSSHTMTSPIICENVEISSRRVGEHACNRCQTTIDYVDAMSCAIEKSQSCFRCRENPVACTIDFLAMIVQQPQLSIYSFGSFKHPGCSYFFLSFLTDEQVESWLKFALQNDIEECSQFPFTSKVTLENFLL